MVTKRILEDICGDECDGRYCILKEFVLHSGFNDRQLEQLKCIEKYKYDQSKNEGMDIGWQEAHRRWVDSGYAGIFAKVYNPDLTHTQIYKKVMQSVDI